MKNTLITIEKDQDDLNAINNIVINHDLDLSVEPMWDCGELAGYHIYKEIDKFHSELIYENEKIIHCFIFIDGYKQGRT